MKFKRIFLMVLDSLGVGESADAMEYNSKGANTLEHINEKCDLFIPNLKKIGFLNTITSVDTETDAYYTVAKPTNVGKDSLSGHYEMIGIKNDTAYQSFNQGLPYEMIHDIELVTGRKLIGNVCSHDGSIIQELGERQVNYGALIIYTSADSDIQIAAHEDCIPIATLHEYCAKIRQLTYYRNYKVARIIARPFNGTPGKYKFINSGRKDFAIKPPRETILDRLVAKNLNVIGIGKITDLFDGKGINKTIKANNNTEAMNKLLDIIDKDFVGLCFVNLNDFDSLYGHNRDVEGYASVIEDLDVDIPIILNKLEIDDLLIITADHGNDPTFEGNEHTRENVPVILYSRNFKTPRRLPPFETLADIGATIADNFEVDEPEIGKSILEELE